MYADPTDIVSDQELRGVIANDRGPSDHAGRGAGAKAARQYHRGMKKLRREAPCALLGMLDRSDPYYEDVCLWRCVFACQEHP